MPTTDQLAFDLPGVLPLRLSVRGRPATTGRPTTARREGSVANPESVVGERVWLVWEDDEVLGVYGDPAVAAADVEMLRRNVVGVGSATTYECLPVPVFTTVRHQRGGRVGDAR